MVEINRDEERPHNKKGERKWYFSGMRRGFPNFSLYRNLKGGKKRTPPNHRSIGTRVFAQKPARLNSSRLSGEGERERETRRVFAGSPIHYLLLMVFFLFNFIFYLKPDTIMKRSSSYSQSSKKI